jgi:ABC-type transport system involved in multi-copper enzyme maturation permease subunit
MTDRRSAQVPGTATMVWTLAGLTLTRLRRGKAIWIGALIAALPVVFAASGALPVSASMDRKILLAVTPVLALLPAMFVASSLGEELESRTSTYLWSRPIARWAVLAGKLAALVPLVIALTVGGWAVAIALVTRAAPSLISCAAIAAGCAAISLVAAGIATLVPKHGMALTISYVLVDMFFGAWPFSLAELSVTHQVRAMANLRGEPPMLAGPLIGMIVVAAIWAVVALSRVRRLES